MKSKEKINNERRSFFAKFGFGALSAALVSVLPIKLFASSHNEEQKKVFVSINPLAVKRTVKESSPKQ